MGLAYQGPAASVLVPEVFSGAGSLRDVVQAQPGLPQHVTLAHPPQSVLPAQRVVPGWRPRQEEETTSSPDFRKPVGERWLRGHGARVRAVGLPRAMWGPHHPLCCGIPVPQDPTPEAGRECNSRGLLTQWGYHSAALPCQLCPAGEPGGDRCCLRRKQKQTETETPQHPSSLHFGQGSRERKREPGLCAW